MGGRGAKSGVSKGAVRTNADYSISESIKNEFINQGLNSNIAGIRKKAEQGTGNYSYKSAQAVSADIVEGLTNNVKVHEKNGNTLVEGITADGKHVYYANASNSPEINRILSKKAERAEKSLKLANERADQDLTGKTTTTYDKWYKNNRKKFDAWYNGAK